jgi:xyloglucan-specific endo-beta-1,4-glucanase
MNSLLLSLMGAALAVSGASAAEFCDQWGSTTTGNYILYNNLWGKDSATSGSQCTGLDSANGNTVAWHTAFNWAGAPVQVKSYANVNLKFTPLQLNKISSIPSTISYSYASTGSLVADLSYDLFTASTPTGKNEYEIMIWLAAIGGAGPISSTGAPIATVTIAGNSFKLYKGPNGSTTVFSFVATKQINTFSGDLMGFVSYLTKNQGLPTTQYLNTVQCGTEPFIATNAKLTVSKYSVEIK